MKYNLCIGKILYSLYSQQFLNTDNSFSYEVYEKGKAEQVSFQSYEIILEVHYKYWTVLLQKKKKTFAVFEFCVEAQSPAVVLENIKIT